MEKIRTRITVSYDVEIEIWDNATKEEIANRISEVSIPELDTRDEAVHYHADSFLPLTNDKGENVLFDEEWNIL